MNVFRPLPAAALLLPFLLLAASPARADLVVLRDGHEYQGTLLRATASDITFRRSGSATDETVWPRAAVLRVRLQQQREWDGIPQADAIPDPELQELRRDLPALAARHATATVLILLERTAVQLRSAQTWTEDERFIGLMLKEEGERITVRRHFFRKDAGTFAIRHAVTIRPDGAVLHLDDNAVQEESPFATLPVYDRVTGSRFAFPEGKPGNLFDAAVHSERVTPVPDQPFFGEYLFGGEDPTHRAEVEILVPPGVPFRWQMVNDPEEVVTHTAETTAGGVLHRWRRLDAPRLLPEPLQPPVADVVPRLVVTASERSWEELAGTAADAIRAADAQFPELPPPPATDAAGIWDAVSRQIEEIPLPPSVTGFRPADPRETLRLRRAAPLDRCYLFYRWLKAANIPDVEWTWLRPRAAGRPAGGAPSLLAFQTPAVRLARNGGGAAAVAVPGDDRGTLAEDTLQNTGALFLDPAHGLTPAAAPPDAPVPGLDRVVRIDFDRAGNAAVRDTLTFRGERARELRAWRSLTAEEIRLRVERLARDINARATGIHHELRGDIAANTSPLELALTYTIPGFADVRPELACLNLPWLAADASVTGRGERRLPLFWEGPAADSVTVEIGVPEGWRRAAGGDDLTLDRPPLKLQALTAAAEGGRTRFTVRQVRDTLAAPAADYPAFKAAVEQRAALGRLFWIWLIP